MSYLNGQHLCNLFAGGIYTLLYALYKYSTSITNQPTKCSGSVAVATDHKTLQAAAWKVAWSGPELWAVWTEHQVHWKCQIVATTLVGNAVSAQTSWLGVPSLIQYGRHSPFAIVLFDIKMTSIWYQFVLKFALKLFLNSKMAPWLDTAFSWNYTKITSIRGIVPLVWYFNFTKT